MLFTALAWCKVFSSPEQTAFHVIDIDDCISGNILLRHSFGGQDSSGVPILSDFCLSEIEITAAVSLADLGAHILLASAMPMDTKKRDGILYPLLNNNNFILM